MMNRKIIFLLLSIAILSIIDSLAQDLPSDSTDLKYERTDKFLLPQINYDWISFQIKAQITTEEEQPPQIQIFVVNRIDSIIYLNFNKSGIELLRMVFTPDEVIYVNKMSESYYQGGYEPLTSMIGVPLDFYLLQSILNAVDLKGFTPELEFFEKDSLLHLTSPHRTNASTKMIIMQQVLLNPDFSIALNEITDLGLRYSLLAKYDEYMTISDFPFYSKIRLDVESFDMVLEGEIKNVKINVPGPTTIRIPSKFTPLIDKQ